MRAAVDAEGARDVVEAVRRRIREGAREIIVESDGAILSDAAVLRGLHGIPGLRVRVPVPTFDAEVHARLGRRVHPREVIRGIARASSVGLHVDVVLPIAEALGPAAGRVHGLSRAAPRVMRYLLVPVPDDLAPRAPDAIHAEIEEARAVGRELSLQVLVDDETRVDTELQAVLAGIKPVIRLSTEAADEEAFVARYATFGLVTCSADGTFIHEDGTHSRRMRLIYVARDLETAERVRAVEAKTFVPYTDLNARAAEYRDLGMALGYPRCCVDSYVARVVLDPESEMGGKDLTEPYVVARGGWVPDPAWELDHFLFETGNALISFTPCTYRCQVALDVARRILAYVERVSPLGAARIRRRLSTDLVIGRQGARVMVDLVDGMIVAAHPRRTALGAFVHRLDHELVAQIVGHPVGDDGRVQLDETHPHPHPPIALRFRGVDAR